MLRIKWLHSNSGSTASDTRLSDPISRPELRRRQSQDEENPEFVERTKRRIEW